MSELKEDKKKEIYSNASSSSWRYLSRDSSFANHTDVMINDESKEMLVLPLPIGCNKRAADLYLKIVLSHVKGSQANPEFMSIDEIANYVINGANDVVLGFGTTPLDRISTSIECWYRISANLVMTIERDTMCDITFRPMHSKKAE